MASVPVGEETVYGRVDRAGRLVEADGALSRLQVEAGGEIGELFALPQIAAVARLAFSLNVPVERAAIAGSAQGDYDLWVHASPDGDDVVLAIQGWTLRPSAPARFAASPVSVAVASESAAAELNWSTDAEMRMSEVSPGLLALLNVTADEALQVPIARLVQLVDNDDGDMPLLQAIAARRAFSGQRAVARAEPRTDLLIEGEPVVAEDGSFLGYRGRVVPANGVAVRAESGRGDDEAPAGGLETVLHAPLSSIIADAERIVERAEGPLRSDYASYGTDIAAAARHLAHVIESAGHDPEYGHGRIDLGALAAEAAMLVEPAAQERGVRIDVDETGLLPSRGEEHAVIQILVNLIGNATRHSPAGAAVTLKFSRDERQVAVSVCDRGRGIDPADQQRIFEPFERADEDPGGTGLGLAISRRLARSMGGEVSLESTMGEGACFTLSLPAD